MSELKGEKILLTGPTSQVAWPIAQALARANEVYGLARLSDPDDREKLKQIGVTPLPLDLGRDALDDVPADCTVVLNFAVIKTGDFVYDLTANAEGAGRLLSRCRKARAFLHCSSAAVYEPMRGAIKEDGALGDSHRSMFPTYSLAKIAAENVVRFAAREWNVPTTIARFSVPYGNNGGWPWYHLMMMQAGQSIPVHVDQPCVYNLIHEDDYIAQIPRLLEIASVPATTINWGGEPVALEDWVAYLGEITGLTPKLKPTTHAIPGIELDVSRLRELVGATRVAWRDGVKRLVEARAPQMLR